MNNKKLFKELIEEFSFLANKCIYLLIQQYNLKCHPSRARVLSLAPPKGELNYRDDNIKFRFHGEGCWFKYNGKEIDFNFDDNGELKGFGVYNLRSFAKSIGDKYSPFVEKKVIEKYLLKFEEDGIIINTNPPYYLYKLKL